MSIYAIELNNSYANQEFDLMIDDVKSTLHVLLQTVNGVLLLTSYVNNEQVGQATICLPNTYVYGYPWIVERMGGNFIFDTGNSDNYPNYENFGTTCNLYFVTSDELENG